MNMYKHGQQQALKQLNLIKKGVAPQQLELPHTKPNPLLRFAKKHPLMALGGAIGLGYGAHGVLRGRDPSPQPAYSMAPHPLRQGTVY